MIINEVKKYMLPTKCWFDYTTVVVTGASSGIGKGIVKKLIFEHGCTVIGVARNEEKMKELEHELGFYAKNFSYYLFDVSKEESWIEFKEELKKREIVVDMLINNAGILPHFDKFTHYEVSYIKKAMDINFFSIVYGMRYMMPNIIRSKEKKCAIVNVASSAALCSLAGTSVYSASKAAVKSFTDAVREETRGQFYIGLICPGFTKTNIFRDQNKTTDSRAQKAMDFISSDVDIMVDKIVDGIWAKREDMVFGVDAVLMDVGAKIAGTKTSKVASKVMKISNIEMFRDIFQSR